MLVYEVTYLPYGTRFDQMKILYMAHSFPPTGYAAAVNTYRIVKGLVNKGHKLIVFCSRTANKHATGLELQDENRPYPSDVYYSFPTPLLLSVVISHLFNASKTLGRSYDMLITQFARAGMTGTCIFDVHYFPSTVYPFGKVSLKCSRILTS